MIIFSRTPLKIGAIHSAPLTLKFEEPKVMLTAMVMREVTYADFKEYWKNKGVPDWRLEHPVTFHYYEVHTD